MDVTEPLDADLRCFHGTDDQPLCDDCVRDVLAGVVTSRDRLADEHQGAVEAIEAAHAALAATHDDREAANSAHKVLDAWLSTHRGQ